MATVIGGIGTSHAPTIGVAWDRGQQQEPAWAPLFEGYVPARRWLDEMRPDLFLIVYNDHVNQFFFDAYPTFALGVGATHAQADELSREVQSALMQLPDKQRAAIVLTVYGGHNHVEAAAILGCSEPTISWRIFSARRKLKKILSRKGGSHE